MTVTPRGAWNEIGALVVPNKPENATIWTADSQFLNELLFVSALEDGKPIFKQPKNLPKFSKGADRIELAEFVRATFAAVNRNQVVELETRPIDFLGGPGVLTEFDVAYPDGAPGRMLAAAVTQGGRFYMIAWRGVGDYYYANRRNEVMVELVGFVE